MPPSLPDTAPLPSERFEPRHKSRRWLGWRAVARFGLALVLAAWSLLLLAWLTLHWGILPHVNEWRPQVEARASAALGVPVRIGRIEVQSQGWVPALRLQDVTLLDPQGREALRLPRVAAAVSARSLFTLSLRFEQLLIEGARLEVRRDAQGRLFVAGLQVKGGAGDGGDVAADWFFEQHEFVIRHGSLRWVDEQAGAGALELADVDLVVRNGLKHHAMRLDATPPAEWGSRFSLRGRFTQPLLARHGDWSRWSGTLHAQLPQADVRQLRRHVALPFELTEGEGALRAWIDVERGQAQAATVDLALNAVNLRLRRDLQPLELDRVHGRISARRDKTGVQLAADNLSFVTAAGQAWPRGNMKLAWLQRQDAPDQPVTGGVFTADQLDLNLMAEVAERLPLGTAVHKLIDPLAARGQVHGLSARWDGPLDAPAHYQVKARLAGLSIAALPAADPHAAGRPGWRNANVELRATESGGDATISLIDGAMVFPGVFEQQEVPLERFDARVSWQLDRPRKAPPGTPPALTVELKNVRFANAEAAGEFDATWRTGAGAADRYPGVLQLSGQLSRGAATSVARYLPLGIPASTRQYVASAVRGGRIDAASFRVKGKLQQFPFANAREGEFRIAGHVSDVDFAYVPGSAGTAPPWPAFSKVAGELVFDRDSMQIHQAQASVGGYELSRVEGGIRSLGHKPVLVIEGQGRGALADALRFVNATPIADWTDQALRTATGSGMSELRLALALPLEDMARSTVKGTLSLLGNDVRMRADLPLLAGARGRIAFGHKGFTLHNVSARALGGELVLEGGTQADGALRIQADGTASADGLRRTAEVPVLARMAASFSGQTAYRLTVSSHTGRTELSLSSPLTGLALDLPAPLRKSAEAALPLRIQLQPGADSTRPRDSLRIELGQVLQANYQRDLAHEQPQVTSGAVGVMEPAPAPVAGVAANVNLGSFDADAWRQLLDRWTDDGSRPRTGTEAPAGDPAPWAAYLPRQLAVRAQELRLGGRRLTQLVGHVAALPGDAGWRAQLVAEQLAGTLDYRPSGNAGAGRVHARLTRLTLPPSEVASVESLLDQAPASVPALDIVVDDFELNGKRLGKLEVEAVNRAEGGARDWRLAKLNLGTPEAQLQASGHWSPSATPGGRRVMVLNFKLDVADSGALLQRLGTPGALKGGKGQLQGQVSWQGSPFTLDYRSMNGQLKVALDQGQFLKAGAGAARLLGVLSLQSLPRRLVLDFRDLFEEGFAFDNVSGDVRIHDGVASSNNLRMRGVQAVVLMEGEADLQRETQDLRVIVVPEINAGTASLAYAAINPVVGLSTFVAQLFLRKPLMQAGTREFHVTGPWDDPKVVRVERKLTDPLPDMDPAPEARVPSPQARNEPTAVPE
ncbi:YhdP family protein [Ideonella sp. BN130291]|uniref:YhdP family protein n=1 Tax=Ideonella sp. BN130291 TaxID=3112940 RepID=UPI002E259808|nr:YhdP family protein [Ideonella sp. BN130291]